MLQHVVPQQVILLGARLDKRIVAIERQVAIGIEAGCNAQGIGRQVALEAVIATHPKQPAGIRRQVKAPIAQCVELPVAAVVFGPNLDVTA